MFLAARIAAAGPPASEPGFVDWPLPYTAFNLFDAGVADVNDDGNLDVYTSDHSATQLMLAGDGKGGFEDRLSAWRLDQNPDFPGFEVPKSRPGLGAPGLHIYRDVSQFVLAARATGRVPPIRGSVRLAPGATVVGSRHFRHRLEPAPGRPHETILSFEAESDGFLIFRPQILEVPLSFEIDGGLPLDAVHVGARGVPPASRSFTLLLRDRHGMAWADVDRDGGLDVFVNRGGLTGHLAEMPGLVRDELLVQTRGGFADRIGGLGFDKGDCRGRKAAWVDFDGDGSLELHSGCFQGLDRFYRRAEDLGFQDIGPRL